MEIEIVWGAGEGTTDLGAFDAALAHAGIHNYNLVRLSSVIPETATVVETGTHDGRWAVGELVGAVVADHNSTTPGETVAAGLGWARASRGGVFFEATAATGEEVERLVRAGVESGMQTRPTWDWEGGIETRVVEHTVEAGGAAVVAAVYGPVGR